MRGVGVILATGHYFFSTSRNSFSSTRWVCSLLLRGNRRQDLFAQIVSHRFDLFIEGLPFVGDHQQSLTFVAGGGDALNQSEGDQTMDQRHNGRALHPQLLRQFALRQRLLVAGDGRYRHPAGLAETEIFQPTIDRQPPVVRGEV